jgi:hypothetical protein
MPMQSIPQANPMQATAGALQKAKQPAQPAQPQATANAGSDQFSDDITKNLQAHLNSLDPRQKKFLADSLQHYANIVIPVLGIVCGQEVFQYFVQIYQQMSGKGKPQQQNSAPNAQPQGPQNNAQMPPQGQPQVQPQGQPPAQQPQGVPPQQ